MERACEGKVALVTGASRGIGAAIARRLAAEGADVVVTARTMDPGPTSPGSLAETVDEITVAGGRAVAIPADLSISNERTRLVHEAVRRAGDVDILVNNAAVTYFIPIVELPWKRYALMFEVQVRAAVELAQLVLPGMRDRRRGWILNLSSRAAIHPLGPPYQGAMKRWGGTAYGMCKAALERFTTGLAAEVYDDGVAVNALSPWRIVPTHGATEHHLVPKDPRFVEPVEWMAEAAVALCSGEPARLTGRIAHSEPLLAELKRIPRTLDGSAPAPPAAVF